MNDPMDTETSSEIFRRIEEICNSIMVVKEVAQSYL